MIDTARLISCGVQPTQARMWAPLLRETCRHFQIVTTHQQAAFIAQATHESSDLTRLEESLFYRRPESIRAAFKRMRDKTDAELWLLCSSPVKHNGERMANTVYANINGNGDIASGDGWRFRGGGPFQLTGRDNYRKCGEFLNCAFEQGPDLVRVVGLNAAMSAGWFWKTKGCNDMASIDDISKRVNGGTNGLEDRRKRYRTALIALAG